MPEITRSEWDAFISNHPNAHILQTSAWGQLKAAFGWEIAHVVAGGSGAQLLFRRLPLGFSLAYIPRGPLGPVTENLWMAIDAVCQRYRAVLLKIEPDLVKYDPPEILPGFRASVHSIQPPRTLLVDLQPDEGQILARMKQKTRYNIRLAEKKGVRIFSSNDLERFQALMDITGERDGFGVHNQAYYQTAYSLFHPIGGCELLAAEFQGTWLAALLVFRHGGRAWYFYGASSDQHRNLMPTYLLQWEAMRWAKSAGCQEYDLWGVPDEDEATLEEKFITRSDGLWGVYRFKRGFGGELRRAPGPWDRVYNQPLYALYEIWTRRLGSA
jgi:peptidoglycan pentaglycine glycine transferase (the first glycine)